MIAPSLHAYLRERGVRLSIAKTPPLSEPYNSLSLRVEAPAGALTAPLRDAIARHKAELVQFVFELEERAAILEYEQDNAHQEADQLARSCVHGGHASPDGAMWLRDLATHHPDVQAALEVFDAQIVDVRAIPPGYWQPPADVLERMEATFSA